MTRTKNKNKATCNGVISTINTNNSASGVHRILWGTQGPNMAVLAIPYWTHSGLPGYQKRLFWSLWYTPRVYSIYAYPIGYILGYPGTKNGHIGHYRVPKTLNLAILEKVPGYAKSMYPRYCTHSGVPGTINRCFGHTRGQRVLYSPNLGNIKSWVRMILANILDCFMHIYTDVRIVYLKRKTNKP